MFKTLVPHLICPGCHGSLIWSIEDETSLKIISAAIKCDQCSESYFINEEIACFLTAADMVNDNWQKGEDYLSRFMKSHPSVKNKLFNTPISELNAADIYTRADILWTEGNSQEANQLYEMGYDLAYSDEVKEAVLNQFDYLINSIKETQGFVVDIASGNGRLVKKILEDTNLNVILSDLSYSVLKRTYKSLVSAGYENRISCIAFNAGKSPFKDKAIDIITSYVGFQNMSDIKPVVVEAERIAKEIITICTFCPEDDLNHKEALEEWGLTQSWYRNEFIRNFNLSGLDIDIRNQEIVNVHPTPKAEIIKGFDIDGIPVCDSKFEYCTIVGKAIV